MEENATGSFIRSTLRTQGAILGGVIALLWILELLDWIVFRGALDTLGVRPRTLNGLFGIFLAPFLHAGFRHLLANTIPFAVLGWFVMMRRVWDFFSVSFVTILISGTGIWLFGATSSVHLGASGLVFGYFGYLLLRGYFERSVSSILWSVFVVFLVRI